MGNHSPLDIDAHGGDEPRLRLVRLPELRHWILVPLLLIAITVGSGLVLVSSRSATAADFSIDRLLSSHHDPVLNFLALAVNYGLGPPGAVSLLAATCLLLLWRRSPVSAVAVAALTASGWILAALIKIVVNRQRPNPLQLADPLAPETGSNSFPSGHTAFAAAFAIAIILLFRATRWRWPVTAAGIVFAGGVAASRVYIGVHYPTDVAASFLVAIAGCLLCAGFWNRYSGALFRKATWLARFGPLPTEPADPAAPAAAPG